MFFKKSYYTYENHVRQWNFSIFHCLKKKKVKSLQTSEVNLFPDNLNYSVGFHLFAELPWKYRKIYLNCQLCKRHQKEFRQSLQKLTVEQAKLTKIHIFLRCIFHFFGTWWCCTFSINHIVWNHSFKSWWTIKICHDQSRVFCIRDYTS